MGTKKIISTISWLIGAGISSVRYYDYNKHPKLDGAKSYWRGNILCFQIDGKEYCFKRVEELEQQVPAKANI